MFPKALVEASREMRDKLLSLEEVTIFHDTDPDGVFSAAILEDFLLKNGVRVNAFGRDREKVRFGGNVALLDLAYRYGRRPGTIFYIDHHEPDKLPENVHPLNPWLLGVENPFKWNTSLLAWLVADQNKEYEWAAAAGHWADHCVHEPTKKWIESVKERYGGDILTAAKFVGLAKYFDEVSPDEVRELVRGAASPTDIVANRKLQRLNKIIEEELRRHLEVLEAERGPVVTYIVDTPIKKLKSPLSTIISDRYPETIYVICQQKGEDLDCSLRFQEAIRYGVHLGEVAREAARLFGGSGGGHPPAAAVRIPLEHRDVFLRWIRERLESLYSKGRSAQRF